VGDHFFRTFVVILAVSIPLQLLQMGLLFPFPTQCPPLNSRRGVVIFYRVEGSFKGRAPALHCIGVISALYRSIIGFVNGRYGR
jgi:hypothetical protein